MEAPGFWDDPDAAQKVNKQLKDVNDRIQQYEQLHDGVSDTLTLTQLYDFLALVSKPAAAKTV